MARALATLCVALAAIFASAQSAAAGGWAVTTIDSFPESLVAGERYEIGYTIRQHGVTPIDVERIGGTEIRGASAVGETFSFRGARSGPTGHYVASVAVPSAGTWTIEVTQGPFAPQKLGAFTVAVPAGTAVVAGSSSAVVPAPTEESSPAIAPAPTDRLRLALAFTSGAAVALFAGMLALYVRGTRREQTVAAA